jgi:hypothetical protein
MDAQSRDRWCGRVAAWCGLLLLCGWLPVAVRAYEPEVHQRLTFNAAHWLNRCVVGTDVPAITPLEVRMIARSNMGLADTSNFVRLFRWGYFDPAVSDDRRWLWVVNTRFTDHFQSLVASLHEADDEVARYKELGRIVSYIQLVSEPARAIPVYAARFWRGNVRDRFERFDLSPSALQALMDHDCDIFDPHPESFHRELEAVAADTIAAVRAPMDGLPATWEVFWQLPERPGDFGAYGPAGNSFGRRVGFDCGDDGQERCVLVDDDPLYVQFALARYVAAVRATARAMWLVQSRYGVEGSPPAVPR